MAEKDNISSLVSHFESTTLCGKSESGTKNVFFINVVMVESMSIKLLVSVYILVLQVD